MIRAMFRCRSAIHLLPLLLLAPAGCGSGEPEEARWAVVARQLPWQDATTPSPSRPLATTWRWDGPGVPAGAESGAAAAWKPGPGTTATVRDGRLVLSGDGPLLLRGPQAFDVDPELHHSLALRFAATDIGGMGVAWRAEGEDFADERRLAGLPIQADGTFADHLQPLDALRGVGDANDAAAGVHELELRWWPSSEDAEVVIESLALLSIFDDPGGRAFTPARLRRGWVEREGLAARVPARLKLPHRRRGEERLRLGVAVAGGHAARVTLTAGGTLAQVTARPGDAWHELELDLAQLPEGAGAEIELTIEPAHAADHGDLATAVLLGSPMILRRQPGPPLPPVILYVEDTLGAGHLSLHGYGPTTDPFLVELAAQGVTVERARAPSPWTRPSMSSLLTGRTPLGHGNRSHRRRVPDALATLPEVLADAGWITVSLVTNYHAGRWAGLHQGFDLHHEPEAFGLPLPGDTRTAGRIHARLLELLDAHEGLPLFVLAHALDPHAPYQPGSDDLFAMVRDPAGRPRPPAGHADPDRFREATLGYDAEIAGVDGWLRALDGELARRGMADETLLVFTSDHGEAFGEYGRWGHHQSLRDTELWVPLVLRWPGRLPAGRRLDLPFSLTDLAPTLLGLLGQPVPAAWEGHDLSARFTARGPDPDGTEPSAARHSRPIFLDALYNPDQDQHGEESGVIQGGFKLLARLEDDALRPAALYDLATDPGEIHDLLGDAGQATRVAGLLDLLRQARAGSPAIQDGDAAGLDPALAEWMRQMGYLR